MLKIGDVIEYNNENLLVLDIGSIYVIAYKNFNQNHIAIAKKNKNERYYDYLQSGIQPENISLIKLEGILPNGIRFS